MQQRARKRRPAPPRPPLRYFRREPRVTTATGKHRPPSRPQRLPAQRAAGLSSGAAAAPRGFSTGRPGHPTATMRTKSQPQLPAQPGFYCRASDRKSSERTNTKHNCFRNKSVASPLTNSSSLFLGAAQASAVPPHTKGSASRSSSLSNWRPSSTPYNSKAL